MPAPPAHSPAAPGGGSPAPADGPRALVVGWLKVLAGLAAAKALAAVEPTGLLAANLAGVAAFLFIAVPDARLRARGEGWDDYGLPWWGARDGRTWRGWGRGLRDALAVAAIAFPLFALAFVAWAAVAPDLPPALARAVAPHGGLPRLAFRLPERLALLATLQLLVVALPEELFYRGWMQTSWARAAPGRGVRVLGATLGPGFVWTQLLFAAGHLVETQAPWRLATFFPGLLFGWLRERTGSLAAPVVLHALSNLFLFTLQASVYGR